MHFKNYPHDTQTCNLEIESSKAIFLCEISGTVGTSSPVIPPAIPVSHTTDDLVFTWDPETPLDVNKGIELPQLELMSTKHDDCTTNYTTGEQ